MYDHNRASSKRYNKFKGIMRLLPHTIIINSQCRFYALDCYITVGNLGVSSGQVLSIADGTIQVHLSNRTNELNVKIDDRFFVNGQVFKVTGIDDFSREGIVNLTCEKDSINTVNDDVVNGVVGGNACKVDITDGAPVVFRSNDESIATVDARGLVTGVSIGQVTMHRERHKCPYKRCSDG
ncbi:Ig-like domain-containing protein [Paenibacillus sp. J5C_2022]|uniref:Ig-like domain-containing protein n=1 Tax=Paenibacillus sp. J5C2022 TaxID=2977129 RepID=UPI0021D3623D|nr:Ig-like domain-containing protein [Paenibacillus sp. J5C2022]MCU6709223.1 Ig-like domain-containing protein [Paenibacillus sp. J5C2022]